MATNKKTVSVYADDDLLTALEEFKDSGNHKSLNVAIVAILREKLFGDTSDNIQSTLQNQVSSTLDIESLINDAVTNAIAPLVARLEALENTRSEATAPANFTQALTSESEGSSVPKTDRNSIEPLPILDAIVAPSIEKPLPDETLRETIAPSKKSKITYRLNNDGSVVLRSLRGITDKELKRMSNDELKEIGLFKTLMGKDKKFFPVDETLQLQYQEKEIAPSKRQKSEAKSKHARENLTALTTAELRKIYRDTVPFSDRNSEKHTKAEYATKEFMIEAILKA